MKRKNNETNTFTQEGFSLVEVLLAGAMLSALSLAFVGAIVYGWESATFFGNHVRAKALAVEGIEAVRNIRDDDFSDLANGTYGLDDSTGQWEFSGTSDTTDVFTREITISTISTERKQIESEVTWQHNPARGGVFSLATYLTNWARVSAGWDDPAQDDTYNASGSDNGRKVQTSGDYAYVVKNSGSPDFLVLDISDSANISLEGSLSLAGNPRDIAISGDYAFVASTDGNEMQVVDISDPASPSLTGTFNAARGANGNGIDVEDDVACLVRASSNRNEFYVIDVSTPSSPSELDSMNLGTTAYDVVVLGDYAYVATAGTELLVIDISDTSNISQAGSYNAPGGSNAISITGFGDTVILGRDSGEVRLIDVSTPSSPSSIGTFDAQDNVRDMDLNGDNSLLFVGTDLNSAEFQVVDISTPSSPTLYGSANLGGDVNGVAFNSTNNLVVTTSDNNNNEVRIIVPN